MRRKLGKKNPMLLSSTFILNSTTALVKPSMSRRRKNAIEIMKILKMKKISLKMSIFTQWIRILDRLWELLSSRKKYQRQI